MSNNIKKDILKAIKNDNNKSSTNTTSTAVSKCKPVVSKYSVDKEITKHQPKFLLEQENVSNNEKEEK